MRGIIEERLKELWRSFFFNTFGMPSTFEARMMQECKELNDWKPIDSNTPAKKEILLFYQEETIDGTDFFAMQCVGLYIPEYIDVCRQPTHWQELPLPPPPKGIIMEQQFETETTATPDGKIKQTLFCVVNDERVPSMSRFFDTRDDGIREALIDLGWTPPKNNYERT